MTNLYFTICAFFCSLLLLIVFFSKERIKNNETNFFSVLLISSFIDSILMLLIVYIAYVDPNNKILYLLNKLDFTNINYGLGFSIYIFFIYHLRTIKRFIKDID